MSTEISPAKRKHVSCQLRPWVSTKITALGIATYLVLLQFFQSQNIQKQTTNLVGSTAETKPRTILITGAAGFIGMHTALRLAELGHTVIAMDNLNEYYYSSNMKMERLRKLHSTDHNSKIEYIYGDVCDRNLLNRTIQESAVDAILHLASQEAIREDGAVKRPFHYPLNNMDCFVDMLEVLKEQKDKSIQLVYASSSTGYRVNFTLPYVDSPIDEVVSPSHNGEIVRSNELVARAYYSLYKVSSIGLRFTTVYGPWGRPDMRYFRFMGDMVNSTMSSLIQDIASDVRQTMMYIDDAVDGILDALKRKVDGAHTIILDSDCAVSQDELVHVISLQSGVNVDAKVLSAKRTTGTTTVKRTTLKCTSNKFVSLHDGMAKFAEWFKSEDGSRFLSPIQLSSNAPVAASPSEATDLCFVTSMFSTSVDNTDTVRDISHYNHSSPFRYFYFTNLPDLKCDGWEKILMTDLPFHRMITESRWPKFMGWQHPALQSCRAVVYSDANIPPRDRPLAQWEKLTEVALTTPSGISQRSNTRVNLRKHLTILDELEALVKDKKDIRRNVDASKEWFLSQPEFNDDAFGYWNMILVYDPANAKFRELMTTFWAHYSAEDQSWRDQPLYRYVVDRLKIVPATQSSFGEYFHKKKSKDKRHRYSAKDDANANRMVR